MLLRVTALDGGPETSKRGTWCQKRARPRGHLPAASHEAALKAARQGHGRAQGPSPPSGPGTLMSSCGGHGAPPPAAPKTSPWPHENVTHALRGVRVRNAECREGRAEGGSETEIGSRRREEAFVCTEPETPKQGAGEAGKVWLARSAPFPAGAEPGLEASSRSRTLGGGPGRGPRGCTESRCAPRPTARPAAPPARAPHRPGARLPSRPLILCRGGSALSGKARAGGEPVTTTQHCPQRKRSLRHYPDRGVWSLPIKLYSQNQAAGRFGPQARACSPPA